MTLIEPPAPPLAGRRLRRVVRLLNIEPEDPPRLAWGRALMDLDDGRTYLLDCDESKSNLLVFAVPEGPGPLRHVIDRHPIRPAIATADPADPLAFMLAGPIVRVERISLAPHESGVGWFAWCGLRLTFEGGQRVCVGTHLTDVMFPSTAFLLPDEVDGALRYDVIDDAGRATVPR